jgi:hypothetical protein
LLLALGGGKSVAVDGGVDGVGRGGDGVGVGEGELVGVGTETVARADGADPSAGCDGLGFV